MIKSRTQLWFGKYDHCVRFSMPEASVLRYLSHKKIEHIIGLRREWGKRMMTSANPGSWLRAWAKVEITDQNVEDLHTMCDFLTADTRDRKLVISSDVVHLYTTDPTLVRDIMAMPYIVDPVYTQAVAVGTPNTVRLKQPKYAFRTYFRGMSITPEQHASLISFISAQPDIHPSPSVRWFMSIKFTKTQRMFEYYFIDHNDERLMTIMGLVVPGIIRKTVPIQAYK